MFGLGDLDFASSQLLVQLLLDDLLLHGSLSLSGDLLVINDQTSAHLEGVQVANQVFTAV
jgi:hypothetical protein